ncbi:MAG: hypothetical protein ACLFVK_02210 [Dehalococcoidia bacterium]
MRDQPSQDDRGNASQAPERGNQPDPNAPDTAEQTQDVNERVQRVEASLKLVLDHLQTMTRGGEILEIEYSRSVLSSIALGISAVSIIALWSISVLAPERAIDILRFTLGMSLLFLASVVDLAAAPLLRRAINRAIAEQNPSLLTVRKGGWYRWLFPKYWATLKKTSNVIFYHEIVRRSAFVLYVVALGFLIWAAVVM